MTQLECSRLEPQITPWRDLQDEAKIDVHQVAKTIHQDVSVVAVFGLQQVACYGIPGQSDCDVRSITSGHTILHHVVSFCTYEPNWRPVRTQCNPNVHTVLPASPGWLHVIFSEKKIVLLAAQVTQPNSKSISTQDIRGLLV